MMKISQLFDFSKKEFFLPRKTSFSLFLIASAVISVSVGVSGCSSTEKPKEETSVVETRRPRADANLPRARNHNLNLKGLQLRPVDVNGDGKPDVLEYYDNEGHHLLTIRDLNFDLKSDDWEYFDLNGDKIEEEMDLDFDGKPDVVNVYKDKKLDHTMQTSDYSGEFQIVKYFNKKGELERVEQDTNNDGIYDTIDYYEKGVRTKTGFDDNGDGKPDRFEEIAS